MMGDQTTFTYHSQGHALSNGNLFGSDESRFCQDASKDQGKKVMAKGQNYRVVKGVLGDDVLVHDNDSHSGDRVQQHATRHDWDGHDWKKK